MPRIIITILAGRRILLVSNFKLINGDVLLFSTITNKTNETIVAAEKKPVICIE
jgi:hypothetical protein